MKVNLLLHKIRRIGYKKIFGTLESLKKSDKNFGVSSIEMINELHKSVASILELELEEINENNFNFRKIRGQKGVKDVAIKCSLVDIILKKLDDTELKKEILKYKKDILLNNLSIEFIQKQIEGWENKTRNEKIDNLIILKENGYFKNEIYLKELKKLFKNISNRGLSGEYENKYWSLFDYFDSN